MDTYPPTSQEPVPQPVLAYHVPLGPSRPTAVSVLAIIGIIYASLGILNGVGGLVMFVVMRRVMLAGPQVSTVFWWNIANSVVSVGLAAVLLATSILCLKLREAGRLNLVRWAWAYLAWLAFVVVFSLAYVIPAQLAAQPATPGFAPGTMNAIATAGVLVTTAFFAIYPIVVLVFMRKRAIRDAFAADGRSAAAAAAADFR